MTFQFSVPKLVEIHNTRLNIAFYFLTVLMVVFNAFMFIHFKQYTEQITANSRLSTRVVVTSNGSNGAARTAFCGWGSPGDSQDEGGVLCMPICGDAASSAESASCVPLEMTYEEISSNHAFVVTSITDTSWAEPDAVGAAAGAAVGGASELQLGETYVAPTAESFALLFSHGYRVEKEPESFFGLNSGKTRGSSEDVARTVVVGPSGELFREVAPGEEILLTIRDLVSLASELPIDWADDLAAAVAAGEGLELMVQTGCYSDSDDLAAMHARLGRVKVSPEEPACILEVRFTSRHAARSELLGGTDRVRTFRGIRVLCQEGHGSFRFASLQQVFRALTSFIVLIGMPRTALLGFAVCCLGHMSSIYRKAVVEEFSLMDEAAGVATRLMCTGFSFNSLADVEDDDEEGRAVSRNRMKQSLKDILRHQKGLLNDQEIDQMLTFCYSQLVQNRGAKNSLIEEVGGEFLTMMMPATHDSIEEAKISAARRVDITNFCTATTSHETLSFLHLVQLFDHDRKIWPLERFFTPRKLKQYLQEAKARPVSVADAEKEHEQKLREEKSGSQHTLGGVRGGLNRPGAAVVPGASKAGGSEGFAPGDGDMPVPYHMQEFFSEFGEKHEQGQARVREMSALLTQLELEQSTISNTCAEVQRQFRDRWGAFEERERIRDRCLKDVTSALGTLRPEHAAKASGLDAFGELDFRCRSLEALAAEIRRDAGQTAAQVRQALPPPPPMSGMLSVCSGPTSAAQSQRAGGGFGTLPGPPPPPPSTSAPAAGVKR